MLLAKIIGASSYLSVSKPKQSCLRRVLPALTINPLFGRPNERRSGNRATCHNHVFGDGVVGVVTTGVDLVACCVPLSPVFCSVFLAFPFCISNWSDPRKIPSPMQCVPKSTDFLPKFSCPTSWVCHESRWRHSGARVPSFPGWSLFQSESFGGLRTTPHHHHNKRQDTTQFSKSRFSVPELAGLP